MSDRTTMSVRLAPDVVEAVQKKLVDTKIRKFQWLMEALLNEWLQGKKVVEIRSDPDAKYPTEFKQLALVMERGDPATKEAIRSHLRSAAQGLVEQPKTKPFRKAH